VVKANFLAATTPGTKGEVFNCASGINVTIRELADMIASILHVENPEILYDDWVPGDIKVFDIDNNKIRKCLGIEFITDFRQGLEMTVDWAREYFSRKDTNVQRA